MRRILGILVLLPAALLPARSCATKTALATAPVDYTLYREGEVRRDERYFGGWLLTCDVIPRLHQKFCSMRAAARSADGTVVGAMMISTDDQGRPAAIVTVPFGTLLAKGVSLSQPPADGRGRPLAMLWPAQCEGLGCQAVWPMTAGAIQQLRNGQSFQLLFWLTELQPTDLAFPLRPRQKKSVSGTVAAAGFADALRASLP